MSLGVFVKPTSVLGPSATDLGFHTVRLDTDPLFEKLEVSASQLVVTRDFRSNIWRDNPIRLRRLNDAQGVIATKGKGNGSIRWANNKLGRLAGEVRNVRIEDAGKALEYKYCGVVSRSRGRELADKHALGAPLISASGALSGIIVGKEASNALVLPVEQLQSYKPLTFVTFGEDWPKVRVVDAGEATLNPPKRRQHRVEKASQQ
jgi:hypothetical protein